MVYHVYHVFQLIESSIVEVTLVSLGWSLPSCGLPWTPSNMRQTFSTVQPWRLKTPELRSESTCLIVSSVLIRFTSFHMFHYFQLPTYPLLIKKNSNGTSPICRWTTVLQEMMILDSQVRLPRAKSEGEKPLQSAPILPLAQGWKNTTVRQDWAITPRSRRPSKSSTGAWTRHVGTLKTLSNGYHITLYETVVHRRLSSIFPSSEWNRCDQHRVYSSESHPYRKSIDFECPTSFKTVQMCVTFQAWSVWRIKWILNVLQETMLVGGFHRFTRDKNGSLLDSRIILSRDREKLRNRLKPPGWFLHLQRFVNGSQES